MKPKVKAPSFEAISKTLSIIEKYSLSTVCYSSKCPNISECFKRGTATFMIMGNICTRNCKFCNVTSAKPLPLDENEPLKIAKAVKELNLNYVVITSVDRDDLSDYGSTHFYNVIEKIAALNPNTKIESLTPDFRGDINALNLMISSKSYKLAHNIETTKRLHKKLKPKSSYTLSLKVLEYYSKFKITKSSIIVGFGETFEEIEETMRDLKNAGVSQLTIGQYLRPSPKHYPVKKYYSKEEFELLENMAYSIGFKAVVAGELVRSSYFADKL
ncbi:lipoyl synthase [Caminibacter pacificus]|jgi:lipoic acid synthetase